MTSFPELKAEGPQTTTTFGLPKRQCPLWIVQLSDRVDRSTFTELKTKAKMLGGWYSSFKKSDAGFQFLEYESAQKFAALLCDDQDRSEELEARKSRKEQTAGERLTELSLRLHQEAEAVLEADGGKLKNTVRRADMAAGIRARAYSDKALARTISSIAVSLALGDAKYLDGLRHKTHVELLHYLLRRAKTDHIQKEQQEAAKAGPHIPYQEREAAFDRPPNESDVRFTKYPFPHVYKRHLQEAIEAGKRLTGCKQVARRVEKLIRRADDFFDLNPADVPLISDFASRLKSQRFDTTWIESSLTDYKRAQAAGIHNIHELRAALREFLPHVAATPQDDPLRTAEEQLIGKELPGFFPTPKPVIYRMLQLATIHPGNHVLEPSCGKGDILDAIRDGHQDTELTAIEQNRTLEAVLAAKGHEVTFADFLQHSGRYDCIVMNPPFENSQDIEHIQHAYSLLAPGGCLVSVISEGPFFRSDSKANAFRDWLAEVGAETERLPDDAFQGAEAFRQTGVRTRLVSVRK